MPWPYTDYQVNRLIQYVDPRWGSSYVFTLLGNEILEEFEDYLRDLDARAIAQFERERIHWGGIPTVHFPPRRLLYHFAVFDNDEIQRRRQALTAADRRALDFPRPWSGAAWGPTRLHTLRSMLQVRAGEMFPANANLYRFRSMQELGERFISGSWDRGTEIGFGIAGGVTGRAALMQGARTAARGMPQTPSRPPSNPPPNPPPTSGQGVLGGSRPPGPTGSSQRQTLPGIGPGVDDIGHARTLPGPTGGQPRPGSRPASLAAAVEEAETMPTRLGTPGRLLPPGGRVAPMSEQQRQDFVRQITDEGTRMNFRQIRPGRDTDPEYALEWSEWGGVGPPPANGFIVYNARGDIIQIIGRGRF